MIVLTPAVQAARAAKVLKIAWLVEVKFPTPLRVTDAGVNLTVVTPRSDPTPVVFTAVGGMTIGPIRNTVVDFGIEAQVQMPDLDNYWKAAVDAGTVDQASIYIWEAHLGYNNTVLSLGDSTNVVERFAGVVDGDPQITESQATIRAVGPFRNWSLPVGRAMAPNCLHRFKGLNCAYAGADTFCQHTYTACSDKSNTDHYGGFTELIWQQLRMNI